MAEIAEMVDREIYKKRRHINVPKAILKPAAGILNRALWWPVMSADEVEREFLDQVIDPTAKTFKDLGIEPGDISKFTYHYLVRYALPFVAFKSISICLQPFSKDTVAQPSTTCRRRRRRRRGRTGSTCTCWTTSSGVEVLVDDRLVWGFQKGSL